MEGSRGNSERETPEVKPLILSRQTVLTIVAIAIVLWSSAFFLWMQVELDKGLLISHNGLRTNELVVGAAKVASKYGMAIIVLVYLIYLLFAFKYEKLRDVYRIYLMVFFMFGVAGIGGDILKEVFNRPRPFDEYAGEITAFSDGETPAFPSGHATKSVALALPFLLLVASKDNWHKGLKILIAILALAVCYSRVVLGAHYVSDVLAGIGMALICFPLVALLNNKMLSRMTQERLNFAIKIWGVILLALMIFLIVN
ncbi:MAG: phosphatase PAP2 family protein [Anaerolineales bacterium]|jgi:membrane-associated phospholipid phosphatase